MLLSLVLKNLNARRTRTLLTGLAISASVALVVAMTSGIAAFQNVAMGFMDRYMGAVDAELMLNSEAAGLNDTVLKNLQDDPAVRRVMVRLSGDVPIATTRPTVFGSKVSLVGVDRATDAPLDWMRLDKGRWFNTGERGCVIDTGLADSQKLKLGDTFKSRGPNGVMELAVTGIVHKPGPFAAFSQTAYAPIAEVKNYFYGPAAPNRYSLLRIQFNPDADGAAFMDRWQIRTKAIDSHARLKLTREKRDEMQKNFLGLRMLSMLGGAVTMVSAAFIIIATLSMGVAERQRTLAMLRAVGASKMRIAKLVVLEGFGLGVVGVLIGVPLGYGLSVILYLIMRQWIDVPPTLDWLGVVCATAVTLVAAVLSSLLPAWQASRVDPLEALSVVAKPTKRGPPVLATIIGLIVVCIDPYLLYGPMPFGNEKAIRFYGHFFLGLPSLMTGFFLLAPLFIYVIGAVLGPVLAAMLRVPVSVVRQQFTTGLWRLAGTCAALMVGLAVLVVMQVQGKSALASWKLPDKFPDVFIFTKNPGGLTPKQQARVGTSTALVDGDTMPVGTFAPEVGGGLLGLLGTRMPGNTMFVAVDPDRAFRLMELQFVQGSAAEATRMLKLGKHLLITDELHRLKKLDMGSTLSLKNGAGKTIDFTVAGVVWSPGIDVMVSTFDVQQQFEQQSLACVFGSLEDARDLFGVKNVYIMSANFRQSGMSKEDLVNHLRDELGDASLFVADVRELKSKIATNMSYLLMAASTVAWAALLTAALGVANTIVAGIRTRMWQFGILRSVGLYRGVLMRLVLAEAILLGTAGAAMGLTCGAVLTADSRRLVENFMGHHSPLVIPWGVIGIGVSVVVGLSVLAALIPAWKLARTEPLTLLQAGRSAS